jgi:hypothetical protein
MSTLGFKFVGLSGRTLNRDFQESLRRLSQYLTDSD